MIKKKNNELIMLTNCIVNTVKYEPFKSLGKDKHCRIIRTPEY